MDHMVGRVVESIITFLLMFVVCAVATYSRASGGFAGLAIGMTILLVSGASLNPARSIGPAMVKHIYTQDFGSIYLAQLLEPLQESIYRTQEEMHELLLSFAEARATVVRLKGEDRAL
uniref:Uncharacterized protein n=1 Tax=Vitis vinifera TaxID=29760 RepID=F6HSL3_VITVI